jgi:hypothetical protein
LKILPLLFGVARDARVILWPPLPHERQSEEKVQFRPPERKPRTVEIRPVEAGLAA